MDFNSFTKFCYNNKGGLIGAACGVLIAILILWIGLFKMLFIAILGVVGYYIGVTLIQGRNFIKELVDKIIPPGTYK